MHGGREHRLEAIVYNVGVTVSVQAKLESQKKEESYWSISSSPLE
jgi:hypothetical protein